MYSCVHETGHGFFAGVCTPSNATANFRDPPHPQCKGTGAPSPGLQLEEDRYRATVGGALAWRRGKPQPAHCPSTARRLPTHHVECRTRVPQSIACRCAPRRNPLC